MIGEVKPYRNNSDALDSAYVFRNISFNEDTVLELENDGFSYMVIEAQFANNVSGIYALGFENTPGDSKEIGYRQSLQQKYKHDGLTVLNASSIKVNSDDSFLSVAESIMCHITSGYGFQVCKTTPKISVQNYSKGEESDSSSSTVSTSQSNETQSYSNSKLGLSLKHPTDWKVGSLKNGIQLIKEKNGVYVEIRKHNLESPDVQLKQYAGDDIKDRSSSREDFKLLNITETTISGNLPAYKAIYTFLKTENEKDFTTGGTTNKILRIWTFSQENAYHVAYVADKDNYDLYLPIAEKIIASMEFTPIQSNDNSEEEEGDSSDSEKKDNNLILKMKTMILKIKTIIQKIKTMIQKMKTIIRKIKTISQKIKMIIQKMKTIIQKMKTILKIQTAMVILTVKILIGGTLRLDQEIQVISMVMETVSAAKKVSCCGDPRALKIKYDALVSEDQLEK